MLGLLGSGLLWASLPPLEWAPLAWVAPIPWLILVLANKLPGRRPYCGLFFAGTAFWLATTYWLWFPHPPETGAGWAIGSLYLGIFLPAFVVVTRQAVHRWKVPLSVAAPVVWVALEWARGQTPLGFSMACLGHTQVNWTTLIQVADLGGAYLVSGLVMFVAASLASSFGSARLFDGVGIANLTIDHTPGRQRISWLQFVPPATALLAALGYGQWRLQEATTKPSIEPGLTVGVIQGNAAHPAWDPQEIMPAYFRLSCLAVGKTFGDQPQPDPPTPTPDVIIWPETIFPSVLAVVQTKESNGQGLNLEGTGWTEQSFRKAAEIRPKRMHEFARYFQTTMLVGVRTQVASPQGLKRFNSLAQVDPQRGVVGRYDKTHLVMFGEYIPWADRFPVLYRWTPLTGGLAAGARGQLPLEITPQSHQGPPEQDRHPSQQGQATRTGDQQVEEPVRISANICFENTVPHLIRSQVNAQRAAGSEPDLLVNVTYDDWFRCSSELDLHLACAVFRAIECRKPFVIAANEGLSAVIDASGRVLWEAPRDQEAVHVTTVYPDPRTSLYLKIGDWPALGCLFLSLIWIASPVRRVCCAWLLRTPKGSASP